MDKRSDEQRLFDLAKHGWAFSNKEALSHKLKHCSDIAKKLSASDPRNEELKDMRRAYA